MSDKELAKAAADMAVQRLAAFIKDAGPIGMTALESAGLLIQQAIDEVYTTRFEADSIEFIDLDADSGVTE